MTMAKTSIENRLAQVRESRGIGIADLARRVQVSRQSIYAIEAGTFVRTRSWRSGWLVSWKSP